VIVTIIYYLQGIIFSLAGDVFTKFPYHWEKAHTRLQVLCCAPKHYLDRPEQAKNLNSFYYYHILIFFFFKKKSQ